MKPPVLSQTDAERTEGSHMFGKKKQPAIRHNLQRLCDFSHQSEESNSDVLGSYTGTPKDGGKPVQDADDL